MALSLRDYPDHSLQNDPYESPCHLSKKIMSHRVDMSPQKTRDERLRFAMFVKILYKDLKESGDEELFVNAQRLLFFVTSRNRGGDPNYRPLMDSIERRLRILVGEPHWRRAHLLLHLYLARKSRGRPSSSSSSANHKTSSRADCKPSNLVAQTPRVMAV